MNRLILSLGTIFVGVLLLGVSTIAEEITLTTYYPAPYGVYNELTTTGNTYLATTSGNVGIGTTGPNDKLVVLPVADSGIVVRESDNGNDAVRIEGNTTRGIINLNENGTRVIQINAYSSGVSYFNAGNVGIGITNPGAYRLYVNGDSYVNGTLTTASNVGIGGPAQPGANMLSVYGKVVTNFPASGDKEMFSFDLAEDIPAAEDVEPGDVVAIDSKIDQFVVKATKPYDISVAGIISESPAYHIAMPDGKVALALAGRVRCKVTTENGSIKRGDHLTTSSLPGHAMKATKPGPIVGKALEEIERGTGKIMVLVNLGWYGKTE